MQYTDRCTAIEKSQSIQQATITQVEGEDLDDNGHKLEHPQQEVFIQIFILEIGQAEFGQTNELRQLSFKPFDCRDGMRNYMFEMGGV